MSRREPVRITLDPESQPTLSVDETAVLLGVARSTAYAGVLSRDIPSIRIGRRIRIPTAVLARMLTGERPPPDARSGAT
jgi:excisionase family DNA binding protein